MANPNGRKGSAFEIGVLKWLRSRGVTAERLRLSGSKDEGDIVAFIAGKNYSKARGLEEAPPSFVVVKRRNASIERAFVIQDLESWLGERQ